MYLYKQRVLIYDLFIFRLLITNTPSQENYQYKILSYFDGRYIHKNYHV